jgi:hypothetical protein
MLADRQQFDVGETEVGGVGGQGGRQRIPIEEVPCGRAERPETRGV